MARREVRLGQRRHRSQPGRVPGSCRTATMITRLDHITVVAPSLEAGAAYIQGALGVLPGPGRTHPGMATHNLLLALGSDVYLEVISADPGAGPGKRPRWFGLDEMLPGSPARLAAWVASTDDIAKAAVPELGEVESMRREHHTWKMTVRADGSLPLDGAAPLADSARFRRQSSGRLAATRAASSTAADTTSRALPSRCPVRQDRTGLESSSDRDQGQRVPPDCRHPNTVWAETAW